MELTVDQALQQGITAHKEGKLPEAEKLYRAILSAQPNHPDANHNLGVLAVGDGKIPEALSFFKLALEAYPKQEQFWLSYIDGLIKLGRLGTARQILQKGRDYGLKEDKVGRLEARLNATSLSGDISPSRKEVNFLVTLYSQGRLEEALIQGNRLALQFPNNAKVLNILGALYSRRGNHEEALSKYNKAIVLKPNYVEPYSNRGNVLNNLGRYEEAITSCNNAIELEPAFAEAYANLGNALSELGQYEKAIIHYNKAIALKPQFAEACANLGNVLSELDQYEEAIISYNKATALKPQFPEAYNNLGIILGRFKTRKFCERLAKNYLDILNLKIMIRPTTIINSIITLLEHHDVIRKMIQSNKQGELTNSAIELCLRASKIPLLIKIMQVCPIPNLEIEELLTGLRRIFLLKRQELSANCDLLFFQNSLALQCFINEFIYKETKEETAAIQHLEESLQKSFSNNEKLLPYDVACLASYRSLFDYPWARHKAPPSTLEILFKRQIKELNQEHELKEGIPRLNSITDEVSLAVKNQYEENPYPRWVNTKLEPRPLTINEVAAELKLQVISEVDLVVESPQILIAGCGTGQHSMHTASRFKDCRVTAIDLSLSSLAYAERKTKELNITNINYYQADILDLKTLGEQFDVIESGGVLHHMADPIAGWRILTDCLKPKGLMRIGLYSELARQDIIKARSIIAERKIPAYKESICDFRQQIIKLDDPQLNVLKGLNDFYSTSAVRDLIFHVQEHRFTIPKIETTIRELGLKFIGFEFQNSKIIETFKMAYLNNEAIYDLSKWHEYEVLNPRLFAGMYQFWLQKL